MNRTQQAQAAHAPKAADEEEAVWFASAGGTGYRITTAPAVTLKNGAVVVRRKLFRAGRRRQVKSARGPLAEGYLRRYADLHEVHENRLRASKKKNSTPHAP